MSETPKTTPTPWKLEGMRIKDGNNNTIADLRYAANTHYYGNPALIVRSVNAHQKMKSALHAFCLAMSVPKSSMRSEMKSIRQAYDLARDAIKAAESEDGNG